MGQKIKLKKEPRLDAKCDAFPFQTEAVDFVREREYAAVFYEQGLGKTKIAIDLIRSWLTSKDVDTVIVVTKKGLVANWESEFAQHSFLRPMILTSNRAANYSVLNSPARVLLCHFEAIANEPRLPAYLKLRDTAVIIDESARLKNPSAELTKTFFALSPLFKKRVIMTGTPIPNRPEDIWAQIFFLDHGQALGEDYAGFRGQVELSNDMAAKTTEREAFEIALQGVFSRIRDFCIRETKAGSGLSLPNKEYQSIVCEWEPAQYELYERIRKEEKYALIRDGEFRLEDSEAILKRLLRLIQVASNPLLVNERCSAPPGKLRYLQDLLTSIRANNEKCIVWTSFVSNAEWLRSVLREHRAVVIHGGIGIEDRNLAVRRFLEDEEVGVLVAVPAAAKEGLTLTVANHVVFWDRSLSLDDYLQAQDRIHRISQTRTCHIYNLLMEDSVDAWVDSLLAAKEAAAQLVQQDISLEEYQMTMSYDFGEVLRAVLGVEGGHSGRCD